MREGWKRGLERWPGSLPIIRVNGQKAALILIDMQNYYLHENGHFRKLLERDFPDMHAYFMGRVTQHVIPNQLKLLHFFRERQLKVIHVRVGSLLPDGSDQFLRRARRDQARKANFRNGELLTRGTFQHQIIDVLQPMPNELVFDKNSVSAFNSTPIDQILRNFNSEFLVTAGILTNNCVESTARDAADRGYNVVLAEDACATFDDEAHQATLRTFARAFGKVASTDEVLEMLTRSLLSQEEFDW